MKIFIRHRLDRDGSHATIWIIERDKAATSGLLYGVMLADRAEKLLEVFASLGIDIQRDEVNLPANAEPSSKNIVLRQAELFQ